MKYPQLAVIGLAWVQLGLGTCLAAGGTNETTASAQKIGVYDSRVVAYAHFWTKENQQPLNQSKNAATAAKAAGDMAQFNKLEKAFIDAQKKMSREVFSTAPAEEALAALQSKIPEIQKQAGVSALVSKWDEQALGAYKSAKQVDVTDLLVREFNPTQKQLKTIEAIKQQKPVPLDQIDKLNTQ